MSSLSGDRIAGFQEKISLVYLHYLTINMLCSTGTLVPDPPHCSTGLPLAPAPAALRAPEKQPPQDQTTDPATK